MDPKEQQADVAAARGDYGAARDLLRQLAQVQPASFDVLVKLSAMLRATGDAAGSLDAIDRALAVRALDFTALLMRANQLRALGRAQESGPAFGRALAQAPEALPPQLVPVLAMARTEYRAWQGSQAETLRQTVASVTPLTDRLDRFITDTVRLTEPERDGPTHYCYPGLPEQPFLDRARFPWLEALEATTDAIAADFARLVDSRASQLVPYIQYPENVPLEQWAELNQNRDWTAIHLINHGQKVAVNAALCPATMAALASLPQPEIPGAGPNAMFSLLAPHTHIPPHTGITNSRLVCHLPLVVPVGCWFRVGDDRRDWSRGQAWVFDDTIEHEAMNPTDSLRVILIVDVWHPDLCEAERKGIAAVIAAGGSIHGL